MVNGNVAAVIEKPAPVTVAALTVTGAEPVEVMVTDCVADELTATLPKEMLLAFTPSVAVEVFNCKGKIFDTAFAVAVSVTD